MPAVSAGGSNGGTPSGRSAIAMAAGATLFSLPSVVSFWSLVSIAVAGAGMGVTGEAAPDSAVVSAPGAAFAAAAGSADFSGMSTMPQTTPGARPARAVAVGRRRCRPLSALSADAAAVGAGAGEDVVLAEILPASAPCATTVAGPARLPRMSTMPQTTPGARRRGRAASASRVPVADAAVGKPAVFPGTAHTAAGGWLSSAAAGEPTGRAAPARTIARPIGAASDSGPGAISPAGALLSPPISSRKESTLSPW